MAEPSFPQFSRFPLELRNAIWSQFALIRTPIIHSLDLDESVQGYLLWSCSPNPDGTNLPHIPTVRALMQVNSEARKAVLVGRQLQKLHRAKHMRDVLVGGIWDPCHDDNDYHGKNGYTFVNWDIDIFYCHRGVALSPGMGLLTNFVEKIKHIAVEVAGPYVRDDMMCAPNYENLLDGWTWGPLRNLSSLSTVYMVLGPQIGRRLFKASKEYVEDKYERIGWGNNEDGDEWTLIHPFYGLVLDTRGWTTYDNWLCTLPATKYGFHRFNPESHPIPLYIQEMPLRALHALLPSPPPPETEIRQSFPEWANEMILNTKEDAANFSGHPVDVLMVLGHFGEVYHPWGNYRQGY